MSRKGIFSRKGETSVESMKVSLVTEEASGCVLFAVRKRHWARESVWFMRRESRSERERERLIRRKRRTGGRERGHVHRGCIWEVICVQSMTSY